MNQVVGATMKRNHGLIDTDRVLWKSSLFRKRRLMMFLLLPALTMSHLFITDIPFAGGGSQTVASGKTENPKGNLVLCKASFLTQEIP